MKSFLCKGRRVLFTEDYVLVDVYKELPREKCKFQNEPILSSEEVKVFLVERKGYLVKVLVTPKSCEEFYAMIKREVEPSADAAREILKKAYADLYGIELGEVECVEES